MLIVFCVILIILIAIGLTINEFVDTPVGSFLIFVFSVFLVICIIVGICMMGDVAEGTVIDEKIAVYEQENEKIETAIDVLVKEYMAQEEKIMIKTANKESLITLVQLYPNLKSNDLVKKQMDIYVNNNKKIKKLKTKKLNISKTKWCLYFGK